MDFLDFIPVNIFEGIGTFAGLVACAVVAVQVVKEWQDKNPSSLAMVYVVGWVIIFAFWFLYGIRFRAIALWLTNSIALLLQLALLVVVLRKRKKVTPSVP